MPPFTIKHITIILSRARSLVQRDFFGLPVMHEAICAKWPFITKLCRFYSITLNHGLGRPVSTDLRKKTHAKGFTPARHEEAAPHFSPVLFLYFADDPRRIAHAGIRKPGPVPPGVAGLRGQLITATLLRTVAAVMRI